MVFSNINNFYSASPTDRDFDSILSPPGNYLSPASLDSTVSFKDQNFDHKNINNIPTSSLAILNASTNSLNSLYNQNRTMTQAKNVAANSPITDDMNSNVSSNINNDITNNVTSSENKNGKTNFASLNATSESAPVKNSDPSSSPAKATSIEPSTTTNKPDGKTGIVKRKYSRNGCTECKRRRMKCDETKPSCWQCNRLNRQCVYILNAKNKKRKSIVRRKSKTSEDESADGNDNDTSYTDNIPIKTQSTNELINNNDTSALLAGGIDDTSHLHQNISNIDHITAEHSIDAANSNSDNTINHDHKSSSVPNLVPLNQMDGYDVNLLMQNLNDIVSMKLNDSIILNESLKNFDLPGLDIPELLPSMTPHVSSVPISFLVDNVIQFNINITSFRLGAIHDQYLRIFYYDCLDSIAPFFQDQGNPLRDILLSFARNESYLLSAILAIGASIAHRKSNKLEDEKSYCAYLSHCLNLLGEQFKNESNVLNKIEPIILTVILLAWDCIYTMNSQWRSHLKGVTDLFKKIKQGSSSKVLSVAKCWFKVMETFASISTVLGGALHNDDLNIIFEPYDFQYVDSLKFLNIMTPLNEFNLLRGHKEDFDLVIKEVIRALNDIRASEKKDVVNKSGIMNKNIDYLLWTPQQVKGKQPVSYFSTQKILVEIDRQLEYEFISKTGVIPIESQSHPDNSHIEDNAIDIVTLRNNERIAISWYDISHQTQVLSFLLIVLLKLLGIPKESITIQQVVRKIMSFFKFLDSEDPPKNMRTCYSNFAVLIAGLNAMDEETRNLVRRYYEINGSKFRRLTEHNINRLEKVWYGTEDEYKLADQDVLTW